MWNSCWLGLYKREISREISGWAKDWYDSGIVCYMKMNLISLFLCHFGAGTRRVTHCKGSPRPWQYRKYFSELFFTSTISCKVENLVFELFYAHPSLFHISPWLVCLPSSLAPLFFVFFTPTLQMSAPSALQPPLCLFTHPPHLISPLHLVTMQIYLSPQARKTGSSETAKSASAVPANSGHVATPSQPQAKGGSKPETKKTTPSFTLNLQKNTTSQNTSHDTSSYKSPIKSPSQYFQICYWGKGIEIDFLQFAIEVTKPKVIIKSLSQPPEQKLQIKTFLHCWKNKNLIFKLWWVHVFNCRDDMIILCRSSWPCCVWVRTTQALTAFRKTFPLTSLSK